MSAISFKTLTSDDVTTSRTLLHESIPITGTLVSGTYATASSSGREGNVKTFSHGMFQSVYDYPYTSSSANHIFDITSGYSTFMTMSSHDPDQTRNLQANKKLNIHNQMAMQLAGFDTNGNIKRINSTLSGEANSSRGRVFISFSRLLVKDEIKKGSFSLVLGTGSAYATPMSQLLTLTDAEATASYKSNSPAGEYGHLKVNGTGKFCGMIFYQAGIITLDMEQVFSTNSIGFVPSNTEFNGADQGANPTHTSQVLIASASMDQIADAIRHRIQNVSFNNTTELNSTIYFCRAHKGEFNYSSNPTYLSGSKIRVKTIPGSGNEFANPPMAYVTTVGLYSPDNELLAVAKLSEPVKKTPINELNFRVRLDY